MKEYTIFLNILDNSIIFHKDHYDYWGANYSNTLSMDELIHRSLPDTKKAILYTAPEELKITSVSPITPLLEKFNF